MGRPKGSKNSPKDTFKVSQSGADFEELMTKIPYSTFVRMMIRSGLPDAESREICLAFKDLKE